MTPKEIEVYTDMLKNEIRTFANRAPAGVINGSADDAKKWKEAATKGLKLVDSARPSLTKLQESARVLRGFAFAEKK